MVSIKQMLDDFGLTQDEFVSVCITLREFVRDSYIKTNGLSLAIKDILKSESEKLKTLIAVFGLFHFIKSTIEVGGKEIEQNLFSEVMEKILKFNKHMN
jgi:predicted metalloprotease